MVAIEMVSAEMKRRRKLADSVFSTPKCGRTQSFLTGFAVLGGSTEGLLGGRLAQRRAALRGVSAAGARSKFRFVPCVPTLSSALRVPQKEFFGNQD